MRCISKTYGVPMLRKVRIDLPTTLQDNMGELRRYTGEGANAPEFFATSPCIHPSKSVNLNCIASRILATLCFCQ